MRVCSICERELTADLPGLVCSNCGAVVCGHCYHDGELCDDCKFAFLCEDTANRDARLAVLHDH